jgi:hypothetical protein
MGSGQQFNAQFLAGRSNPIGAATWPPLTRRRGLGRQRRRAIPTQGFPRCSSRRAMVDPLEQMISADLVGGDTRVVDVR